ncbi:uncharacterized protein PpBr36_09177, partial [Pyricularia pennisetigena]|uniref:uncharacterized protein n=1 Tax=Pyricularia pennisetigena TaxID=1578925 RepID=UPI00114F3D99
DDVGINQDKALFLPSESMSGTDIPEHMAIPNWWACIRKRLISFMQMLMPVARCGSTTGAQWRRGLRQESCLDK